MLCSHLSLLLPLFSRSLSFWIESSGAQPFHFHPLFILLSISSSEHSVCLSTLEKCCESDVATVIQPLTHFVCMCAQNMLMVWIVCARMCIMRLQSGLALLRGVYPCACLCTVTALEAESKCSAFNKSHNQQSGSKQWHHCSWVPSWSTERTLATLCLGVSVCECMRVTES